MAIVITVLYNKEDASEVVGVVTRDIGELKEIVRTGVTLKQVVDFARFKDPLSLLQQPAQKGVFIRDIEKSTLLTPEQKKQFVDLLVNSGPLDIATFGIGGNRDGVPTAGPDGTPVLPPPIAQAVDAPPQLPPVVIIMLDP